MDGKVQHETTGMVVQRTGSAEPTPATGSLAGLLEAELAPVAIARLQIMAACLGDGSPADEKLGTLAAEIEPAIPSAKTYGGLGGLLQTTLAALHSRQPSQAADSLRGAADALQPYVLDPRFCQVALDGLKTFYRKEFTYRFLSQDKDLAALHGKSLHATWKNIEIWLAGDPDPNHRRCRRLLEYVDGLKQWGRQRVFLFEVDRSYLTLLKEPAEVRRLLGSVYDRPVFPWDAEDPFIGQVTHTAAPGTGEPLLVFKLIATRHYRQVINDVLQPFEERSTNFFVIHLQAGYAELQLEDLPVGAVRSCAEERDALLTVIGRHLDTGKIRLIQLERAMIALMHKAVYPVDAVRMKSTGSEILPDTPVMIALLSAMFANPCPGELSAHLDCTQDILGAEPLHFRLNGNHDYVHFGGIADPVKTHEIVRTLANLCLAPPEHHRSGWKYGWIGPKLDQLKAHPKAQAVLLTAGAIFAPFVWFLVRTVGEYLFSEVFNLITGGLPAEILAITAAIIWMFRFYGAITLWHGLVELATTTRPSFWIELRKARKRSEKSDDEFGLKPS